MNRRLPTLLAAALAACAASTEPSREVVDAAARQPRSWQRVMARVGAEVEVVRAELLRDPLGDLALAAASARGAAELVRGGYTRFRDERVPGFAAMARDAESWLLRIAVEAEQRHGAIARSLLRDGLGHHCQACHDACEAAR